MSNYSAHTRYGITLFLVSVFALAAITPAASQSDVSRVVVTSVLVNESFPEIQIQVKALDSNGGFIPDLNTAQFSLREDGDDLSILDVQTASLPLNVRVVFVIDELALGSRVTSVREAIQSFAQNQMQEGDLVEVLAATESGNAQTIVPLTGDPQKVFEGMEESNYNPGSASGTQLLETVRQGLTDLAALSENTEGLNRMVVFSVSINDQLDLTKTIEKAVQLGVPVHTVLLGAEDIKGALGRLARETTGGDGTISPDDVDDLFGTLAAESVQDQYLIRYRSKVDQAGDHELVVTINGDLSNDVLFTLDDLQLPLVVITAPESDTLIRRAETLLAQNSDRVEPIEQTVAVEVTWPDDHSREVVLERTALVVDGKSLGPATAVRDNGEDIVLLEFTWDLREENTPGENSIDIVIEVEDELGLKGKSEVLPVTVEYIPFEGVGACPEFIADNIPELCSNYNLILPLGSLLVTVAALLLMIVYLRRNPRVQQQVKERLGTMMTNMRSPRTDAGHMGTRLVEPIESAKASLQLIEGRSGTNETVFRLEATTTLGRSGDHAQMVFQSDQGDRSPISRLHCTILEKGDFFEIRDDGSSNGTYLNGTRLRAGDLHRLRDGDMVELAQVHDGGVKFKFQSASRSSHMGTRLVPPSETETKNKLGTTVDDKPKEGHKATTLQEVAQESGDLPKDGYIPTRMKEPEKKDDDTPKDGYTPTKMMK